MYHYVRLSSFFGAMFFCIYTLSPSLIFSSDGKFSRASLRGLKGIYISVEELEPEITNDGLTSDLIRKDVKALLRTARIAVLSKEGWFETNGSPYLYINANVMKLDKTKEYIYSVNISFNQNVYPVRDHVEIMGASTWTTGGIVGITGNLDNIRGSVKSLVEQFIEAYSSVNPE